jgi:hypothetical protein
MYILKRETNWIQELTNVYSLGTHLKKKGYTCFEPDSGRTFISRDVTFNENKIFFGSDNIKQGKHSEFIIPNPEEQPAPAPSELPIQIRPNERTEPHEPDGLNEMQLETEPNSPRQMLRRSSRTLQLSTRLNDLITYSVLKIK